MTTKNLIFFILLPFVSVGSIYIFREHHAANAFAYGPLTIDLGVPLNAPIFTVQNMLPGDCQSHTVQVTNDSQKSVGLVVHGSNVQDNDSLSSVLYITVTKDNDNLHSGTLERFFEDSKTMGGIGLFTLNPSQNVEVKFEVCLDSGASNTYQKNELVFDLIFGEDLSQIQLPKECESLKGKIGFKIDSSERRGRVLGTRANELIYEHEDHEHTDGGGGEDCIVSGDGHGTIHHKKLEKETERALWKFIKRIMRLT